MNDSYLTALMAARTEIEKVDDLHATAKTSLLRSIDDVIDRARRGETGFRPGPTDLARLLVDGGGPRDPAHPVYDAFERVGQALGRESERNVEILPRTTLATLPAGPLPRGYLRLIAPFWVIVPARSAGQGPTSLWTVRSDDERSLVPAFLSQTELTTWAGSTGDVAATLIRLEDLVKLVSETDLDGVVIDPGGADSVIPHLRQADTGAPQDGTIAANSSVSFGPPANAPDSLLAAARHAASQVAAVSEVVIAALVENGRPRLILVVGNDPGREQAIADFAQALRRELPTGTGVDLLPLSSPLGRRIREVVPAIYQRLPKPPVPLPPSPENEDRHD